MLSERTFTVAAVVFVAVSLLFAALFGRLATLFVLINLVMDLVYTYLDPRIVLARSGR